MNKKHEELKEEKNLMNKKHEELIQGRVEVPIVNTGFKCKACQHTEYEEIGNRKKCKNCGKFARKNMRDLTRNDFHPELEIKPDDFLKGKDFEGKNIIIWDISDERKSRKSKFKDSTSRLILFSFEEDENKKLIGWINNGCVINDTVEKLIDDKEIPSLQGIEACYSKTEGADSPYWTLWGNEYD